VHAVVSPFAPTEDLGAIAALLGQVGGGGMVYRMRRAPDEVPLRGFPTLARRQDLAPNGRAAELLGARRVGDDHARGGLDDAATSEGIVLVLGDDLADQPETFGDSAALYVYLGQHGTPAAGHAHFVLPVTSFAEQEGTFINVQGRVQRFWPALEAPGVARPAWLVLGHVLAALAGTPPATKVDEAFHLLAATRPELDGMTYPEIGTRGALLNEPVGLLGSGPAGT
jgi:NADH-quinone oxidoreductase subunit G